MRITARKMFFYLPVAAAVLVLAGRAACRQEEVTAVTSHQRALTDNLPQPMAKRVSELLNQEPRLCSEQELALGQSLGAPAGDGVGPNIPNCYSTLLYVLLGQKVDALDMELGIKTILKESGFPLATVVRPYIVEADRTKAVIPELTKDLKPGDALLFYGHSLQGMAFQHAALFLGNIDGKGYIFYKISLFCGIDGGYEIMPLQDFLQAEVGYDFPSHSYQAIMVHRQTE